jgi:heat shock protein HslJ
MWSFSMSFSQRFLSLIGLLVVTGCASTIDLSTQDISNKVWLLPSLSQVEPEGFFLHPDGHVLMLDEDRKEETQWFIEDNDLLLAGMDILSPVLIDESLCLESASNDNSLVFCPVELEELESEKKYFPTFLKKDSRGTIKAFVQFDASEGVVRGFGGVNNFRGKFSRKDERSVDFGPIMSTRMAGPGMDDEFKLIQCLDRSDGMLVIMEHLYLYQGVKLLCTFSSVPE